VRRLSRRQPPFARAAEEPFRRRGKDALRVLIASVAVAALAHRSTHVSAFSHGIFQAFNDLPGGLRPFVKASYDLGALWAAAVVALAALVARRWRLARDLVVAGVVAWLLARGLGLVLTNRLQHGVGAIIRARVTPGFPDVHLALVTAVVATASPFLARTTRRLSWIVVATLVPAEMYLGVALPRSLACALVLGWGVAGAVLWTFGSPAGRPTLAQVDRAMTDLGHPVHDLELADPQPARHMLVRASDDSGDVLIKVLGRDQTESQLVSKIWRLLWLRDSGPTLFLTRRQEVEHQAFTTMLARDAGVRVPALLTAGTGGPGTALLAERQVGGRSLGDLPPAEIGDELLHDVWSQVADLHAARLSHGRLNTRHVRRAAEGAALVAFDRASTHPGVHGRAADVAELLATTAALIGVDRAVAAAITALGPAEVAASLPMLQPAALTAEGRHIAGEGPGSVADHCEALRNAVAAATGTTVPELEQLQRVRPASLALATGAVVGVASMLASVGDPQQLGRVVVHADAPLLALAVALGLLTNLGFALALAGSVRQRLPFWPNLKLQAAGAFTNLALPFGSQALQVRFLQRQGVDGATAVTSGLVTLLGGTAAQVALFAALIQTSPQHVQGVHIPTGTVVTVLEVLTAAVVAATLAVLTIPPLRRRVAPPVERGWQNVLGLVRSPRELALLLGGSVLAYLLYGLALGACVAAVGAHVPLLSLVAANVGVSLVAALVPFPGGGAAVSSVGLSGAVLALGVPASAAVGAVLLHQLLTTYVPAVPGWMALRSLLAHDEL
jgi:uncharacterized membrane protein YbhN (UPF0104 family)